MDSGRIQVFESLTPRQQRSTLVGMLVLVALIMAVVNTLANGDADWRGLTDNFSTELLGAALTFFIFDLFQERRSKDELKQRLIRDMQSRINGVAVNAVEELRAHGWLANGSLRGTNLRNANLQGADLAGADLREAHFWKANLQDAIFTNARLQGASLEYANLQHAVLFRANLQRAWLQHANLRAVVLTEANLREAQLSYADMQAANMTRASLKKAILRQTTFDKDTILPDDNIQQTRSFWKPNTDMSRFTDPEHAEYWQSPIWPDIDNKS